FYMTTRKMPDEPQFERPIGNHTFHIGREAVLGCSIINLGKHKVTLYLSNNVLSIVPPDIINEETSADVSAQELDNITLLCRASGHPPPKITWRREDYEPMLLKKIGNRDFFKVESYVGSSLPLWRVDRRQMGAFLCIASNDVPPAVSKRITLNVNFPPTVIVPNQLLGAPLGTDVILECTVEAYPNTINYWLKNRGEMLLDGPKYAITEERSSYKVQMKLTIKNFVRSDIGTYNCVSTNSLGKSEGTLRLYEIKLYPSSQSAAEANVGGLTDGTVKQKTAYSKANVLSRTLSVILSIVAIKLCQ
ncbi:lachesin-like, partial [Hyposmocoma kahamanoa]|uniref:lachesin-like n=1 Tax=Hyposmocoma kahamanoa TaxID=1477025 RepID=UPI000E6D9501